MQNQPRKENETRYSNDKNCYSNSDCFNEIPKIPNKYWKWFKKNDAVCVAIGTFALAFATLILAIFTCDSVKYTKRLTEDSHLQIGNIEQMAKATQDMVLATQKSIAVAESSANIAHQNMVIGNTAYFNIKLAISPKLAAGQRFFAHVNFINVGKTPALNVRKLTIFNNDFKNDIHKMQIISNASTNVNKGIIPPTDSVNQDLYTRYIFTDDLINQIYSGERVFSISTGIKYQDIFGNWYWMAEREIFNPKDNSFCEDNTGNEYIKLN